MTITSKLKGVDFFKKLPGDLAEATVTGAGISIIATVMIVVLITLEFTSFMQQKNKTDLVVDQSQQDELLRVNFNVSFPSLPCEFATLTVSDNLGTRRQNLTKTVRKISIDQDMQRIGWAVRDEQLPTPKYDANLYEVYNEEVNINTLWTVPLTDQNFEQALKQHPVVVVNFYAPWCPWCQRLAPVWDVVTAKIHEMYPDSDGRIRVAKVDCTEQMTICRNQQIMGFPSIRVYRSGKDVIKVGNHEEHESYHGDRTKESLIEFMKGLVENQPGQKPSSDIKRTAKGAGCNFSGFVLVKKVPGTFFFQYKSDAHSFDHGLVNASHVVHSFYFDSKPSPFRMATLKKMHPLGLNPDWADKLQGQQFISKTEKATHEHYMQVVQTTIKPLTIRRGMGDYDAYEYTVHSHTFNTEDVPAARIAYDMSPIQIVVTQQRRQWYHFLTTLCAIIGGVFTVLQLLDGLMYQSYQAFKKEQIGKQR
eukprot:TRINITY_DN131_c3_g1_i1.p1 TRINITY_DN131_c3_g1~~TRINITY_DN131_c3_g1_i1.p1  ORF type:complete len:477 (+),score=32.38 TRINITY_DN131_c3_g1_i1:245-1675(+)